MSRNQEFHDSVGRHYVETTMPEESQYQHRLSSFGEPRRLEVYHPEDKTPRVVRRGYVSDAKEGEEGKPGLIGYTDFYREKGGEHFGNITDEHGNKEPLISKAHTNIGFMNVHKQYQGGGVSKQMVNYLDKTTPEDAQINFGHVVHIGAAKVATDLEKRKPGRTHAKDLWYFKDQL